MTREELELLETKKRLLRIAQLENPEAQLEDIEVRSLSSEDKEALKEQQETAKALKKEEEKRRKVLAQIYYHFKVNPKDCTPDEVADMAEALQAGIELATNIQETAILKAFAKIFKKK
jgi:hypothetical protein